MAYATITHFRNLTNMNKDLVSDPVLLEIFPVADRLINKLISTRVNLERLNGKIDGTNKDFKTKNAPICDTTLKNVTSVDSCDVTTNWTASTDATAETVVGKLVEGSGALALGKDGTSEAFASYTKTVTSVDGTGRRLRLTLYIKDTTDLDVADAVVIRIGSAADKYYELVLERKSLKNGINEIDINLLDMGSSGTPVITALVHVYILFNVSATSSTITHGDLVMDYWRLEDIDSPDISDVDVYYATVDDNSGFREYGTRQTITSFQVQEGIITMTTAPTSTTAEDGVYATYSYVSRDMDWNLINTAAAYMAAHLASLRISGSAPNYTAIEDSFARRDLAGAPDEWLRLCFSIVYNAIGYGNDGIGFRRVDTEDLT